MQLSIIMPVWNEASKIVNDIQKLNEFLRGISLKAEIIVVDDGSEDGTAALARRVEVDSQIALNVLEYQPHRGKGYAVRQGMAASSGDYVMFMDCGSNVPLRFINCGLTLLLENQTEIANASRHRPQSKIIKNLIWYRRLTSLIFRKLVRSYLKLPFYLSDTQCGFKFYKGDIGRELYGLCQSDGFLFDLEIILLALKRNYRMLEFPIEWTCDRDSRLALARMLIPVLQELKRLKRKYHI